METRIYHIVLLSLAFLLLTAPAVVCGDVPNHVAEQEAFCHVFVEVDANVAVRPMVPSFDMYSVQTGEFTGRIPFIVDANTQKVRIWTAASKLYKGDVADYNPDSLDVAPIPFLYDSGVEIYPASGTPVGGQDNHVEFIGLHLIDGYPGVLTQSIVFESAQNNHFSQQVDMVVHWDQDDPEKPMGEYSGKVKMLAEVVLPE